MPLKIFFDHTCLIVYAFFCQIISTPKLGINIIKPINPVTFCVQLGSLAAEHWSASRAFSGKKSKNLGIESLLF